MTTLRNDDNRGFTGANNQGFRWALERQVDYVLILNNDTVVEKDFLGPLLHTAHQNERSIVGPKIIFFGSRKLQNIGCNFTSWYGGRNIGQGKDPARFTGSYRPDYLSGCCWLMPIRALRDIGYFDDYFFAYTEDVDYSFRAREAHYELIVESKSVIYHKHSLSTKGSCVKQYYRGRNMKYLLQKYQYPFLVRWMSLVTLGLIVILYNRHLGCLKEYLRGIRTLS
ncbi:MAG: glycosyltransferase family 2 protein [Patescibacteria group bacterium]